MIYAYIKEAEREAERFLTRVADLEDRYSVGEQSYLEITGTPERAAVRRASMDLTRALAKMRNT